MEAVSKRATFRATIPSVNSAPPIPRHLLCVTYSAIVFRAPVTISPLNGCRISARRSEKILRFRISILALRIERRDYVLRKVFRGKGLSMSEDVATKPKMGRPATGHDPMFAFRAPRSIIDTIRNEAVRRDVAYSIIARDALEQYVKSLGERKTV
jgi:hypothetical protein